MKRAILSGLLAMLILLVLPFAISKGHSFAWMSDPPELFKFVGFGVVVGLCSIFANRVGQIFQPLARWVSSIAGGLLAGFVFLCESYIEDHFEEGRLYYKFTTWELKGFLLIAFSTALAILIAELIVKKYPPPVRVS